MRAATVLALVLLSLATTACDLNFDPLGPIPAEEPQQPPQESCPVNLALRGECPGAAPAANQAVGD